MEKDVQRAEKATLLRCFCIEYKVIHFNNINYEENNNFIKINPEYNLSLKDLSEKNSEFLDFYKVNVDENRYITEEYGIRNIPTFIIVKDGEVKTKIVGSADREKLENLISEYTNK